MLAARLGRERKQDTMHGTHRQREEAVDHPPHYGGPDDPYEAIRVIEAWAERNHWDGGEGFTLGNTIKYIARAGAKDDKLTDLKKARWYLDRAIQALE